MSKADNPGAERSQSDIFAPPADAGAPLVTEGVKQVPEPLPGSFEGALSELEAIVSRMESGELTLEQSLSAYKRGATLLQYCQAALNDAQQQVKVLEAGVLKDFSNANENGQ